MHEMSYVVRVVNLAIRTAEANHAVRVGEVCLDLGEMTGLEPFYMEKYYKTAVQDTILEGSTLRIRPVPVRIRCRDCEGIYHPSKENGYRCPACGCGAGAVLSGREMTVTQVVLETEDEEEA